MVSESPGGLTQADLDEFHAAGFLAPYPERFLGHLRTVCPELFDLADEVNRLAMTMHRSCIVPRNDLVRVVGALLVIKAITSYQSAVLLVERGISAEAQLLSRTGIECTIQLALLGKDPGRVDVMRDAQTRHKRTHAQKLLELQAKHGVNLGDERVQAGLLKNAVLEGASDAQLEALAEAAGMSTLYQTAYRSLSGNASHATFGALERYIEKGVDGTPDIVIGPIPDQMPEALELAIGVLLETLAPMEKVFPEAARTEETAMLVARLNALVKARVA